MISTLDVPRYSRSASSLNFKSKTHLLDASILTSNKKALSSSSCLLMTTVVLCTIQKNVTYGNKTEEVLGKLLFLVWSQRPAILIEICHGISQFLRQNAEVLPRIWI